MPTIWTYRLHAIVPQADANASNAFWTLIAPGGDAEAQTHGVPLSVNGEEPVTHRGISSAFTAGMTIESIVSLLHDLYYAVAGEFGG